MQWRFPSDEIMEETRGPLPPKQTLRLILLPMLATFAGLRLYLTSCTSGISIRADTWFFTYFLEYSSRSQPRSFWPLAHGIGRWRCWHRRLWGSVAL
jgi:hypothetical protein